MVLIYWKYEINKLLQFKMIHDFSAAKKGFSLTAIYVSVKSTPLEYEIYTQG